MSAQDYADLSDAELQSIAAERGIEDIESFSRDELVEELQERDVESAADAAASTSQDAAVAQVQADEAQPAQPDEPGGAPQPGQ